MTSRSGRQRRKVCSGATFRRGRKVTRSGRPIWLRLCKRSCRSGWAAGNAVALVISGNGERTAVSFDGHPEGAPVLYVEYTIGGAAASAAGNTAGAVTNIIGSSVLLHRQFDASTPLPEDSPEDEDTQGNATRRTGSLCRSPKPCPSHLTTDNENTGRLGEQYPQDIRCFHYCGHMLDRKSQRLDL